LPRKGDLRQWRDEFALAMRDQGVDAEATPRASRGIVKKPERQVISHKNAGTKPKT
jgi:type IV secretory pathway VirD2 relaxase